MDTGRTMSGGRTAGVVAVGLVTVWLAAGPAQSQAPGSAPGLA